MQCALSGVNGNQVDWFEKELVNENTHAIKDQGISAVIKTAQSMMTTFKFAMRESHDVVHYGLHTGNDSNRVCYD